MSIPRKLHGVAERFFQEWLQSGIDISICHIDQDHKRLFRVVHKTTLFRSFLGFVFILPACWLLWWMWQQSMTKWPLLLAGLLLCAFLIGVGLLLGFSRDELTISRENHSVRRALRLLSMEKSFSAVLPDHGRILLWRELDDGDSSCWWYNITMNEPLGTVFTISREQDTAERFAKQLADFLSCPLEDQENTKMKTERNKGRLIIRDQPLVFWMFYSCFVLGGLAALILALATAPDKTTALIVSIIGIGNIAGGVYMLRREPASILTFDPEPDTLLVRRWHPSGKKDSFYPLSAVSSAEVTIKEHTEGGHVYRPSLCLNESVTIPVAGGT